MVNYLSCLFGAAFELDGKTLTSFGKNALAAKAEPVNFWQLGQWHTTELIGWPLTEYLTAPQRQDPCRTEALSVFEADAIACQV